MELTLSVIAAVIAGVILLVIEYRTRWFARYVNQDKNQNILEYLALRDDLALQAFVDNLIHEKGLDIKSPEEFMRIRANIKEMLENEINLHFISLLSDEDARSLSTLLDKDVSNENLNLFFAQRIPHLDIELAKALEDFRVAFLYSPPKRQHG